MSVFKIDDGIAVPKIRRGVRVRSYYPFRDMEVGQSFAVPLDGRPKIKVTSVIMSAARRYKPKKYTSRHIQEEDAIRVWRTA